MKVGAYEIGAVLGIGQFGEVRLAVHAESRQRYACKIAKGEEPRKMLRREAGMQREIAACYTETSAGRQMLFPGFRELIEQQDKTWLIMEFIEGTPLTTRIPTGVSGGAQTGQAFTEVEIIRIAIQLAEGLKILHERQDPILYRDLKPEHVLLCGGQSEVRVRLLDLGCACRQSEAWKSKAGSRGYAAPEQLMDGMCEQGAYSDIYSFGKILEQMTAGRGINKASRIIGDSRTLKDLKQLIAWCTEEEPEKRMPCMRFVLTELYRMQRGAKTTKADWTRFRLEKCICEE